MAKLEFTRLMVVTGRVVVHADNARGTEVASDPFVLRVATASQPIAAKTATDFLSDQYGLRGYVVSVNIRSVRLVSGDQGWVLVGGKS